jgi:hypothetical protein
MSMIIPFRIGFGKSGNSTTGKPHAILLQTLTYNNVFNELNFYLKTMFEKNNLTNDKTNSSMVYDYILKELLINEGDVFDITFPNMEKPLTFFNPIKIRNKNKHLISFNDNGQTFIIDKVLNEYEFENILTNN